MVYIERNLTKDFEKIKDIYPVISVVGPRQAGKTTFLKEKAKSFDTAYVLFDDPDARNLFEEDIKKFELQYVAGNEITILDEVQYCREAGHNLKYLADKGHKLWVTSELLLQKEVFSYLVGRVSILRLYPFSLQEFMAARKQKVYEASVGKRLIWEHLTYGGYPKVVLTEAVDVKKILLKDLYETMVLKDIAQNFGIQDINSLENFARYLAFSVTGQLNFGEISRTSNISFQTTQKYLDALEKSNVVVRVLPYYTNKIKEITKQPKIYFMDNGIRNHIASSFWIEPDCPQFENYVVTELVKAGFRVKYWRTKAGAEVDCVIEKDGKLVPVEVKLNSQKPSKSFYSFINSYKCGEGFIVYYSGDDKDLKLDKTKVKIRDFYGLLKDLAV